MELPLRAEPRRRMEAVLWFKQLESYVPLIQAIGEFARANLRACPSA